MGKIERKRPATPDRQRRIKGDGENKGSAAPGPGGSRQGNAGHQPDDGPSNPPR